MTKFVANDGTICKSKTHMLEVNKEIERLLLPDIISKVFGIFQSHEESTWFERNVTKRGLDVDSWRL